MFKVGNRINIFKIFDEDFYEFSIISVSFDNNIW